MIGSLSKLYIPCFILSGGCCKYVKSNYNFNGVRYNFTNARYNFTGARYNFANASCNFAGAYYNFTKGSYKFINVRYNYVGGHYINNVADVIKLLAAKSPPTLSRRERTLTNYSVLIMQ